jgi:hypothetical protein
VTRQTDPRSRTAIRASSEQRPLMRIGAVAGVIGVVAQIVLELFLHPSGAHPNDSAAAFAEYAASTSWTAVHLGQFAAALLVSIALIALAGTLRSHGGWPADLALVGALAVAVATAVFGVQMAVDGVALKHAVDAWTGAAPGGAQETAFTMAETVRSIEKGLSALFHFSNGAALLFLGGAVARSWRRQWLGWIGATAGFGFLAGSWATAQTGFSSQASMILLPTGLLAFIFVLGVSASMATGAMSVDSTRRDGPGERHVSTRTTGWSRTP